MGLPWILGNITAFYFTDALDEYIFIILNSLQGVLIFIVLVLTGRGGVLWREKWQSLKEPDLAQNQGSGSVTTGQTGSGGNRISMSDRNSGGVESKTQNSDLGVKNV